MLNYILIGLIATTSFLNLNMAMKLEEWGDDDFDENLAKNKKAFVKFFAPWCGHCKRLAPEWEMTADLLDEKLGAIVKVDCTKSGRKTCERFDVKGYPSVKFIKHKEDADHKVIEYNGERKKEHLYSFAKKYFDPLLIELSNTQIQKFLLNDYDTTFVLFTASKNTEAFKRFEEVAEKYIGAAKFGVSFIKNPSKVVSNASPESVVFQRARKLVTKLEVDTGVEEDVKKFDDFVKNSLHGRVALRDMDIDSFLSRPLATVFVASSMKTNSSYFRMIRNRLFHIAEKFPNLQFAVASSFDYKGLMSVVNFDPTKDELVFIIEEDDAKRYVPKKSIKFDDLKSLPDLLKEFLSDYNDQKLEVFYRSQPIPEINEPGLPMVVVGHNLKSVVSDPKKNVFIKIYAPWCGHCKQLAPVWDRLAEKYKDDSSIVIAKFDATANDIPLDEYQITGFPTLFFSKAGSSKIKPIQYNGARSFEALVSFIEKQVSKVEDAKDEL